MTATVLVVHPGAELYGSDRMLAETVAGLVAAGRRVRVVLPTTGPLTEVLQATGAQVQVADVPVLRKASLTPTGLLGLAWRTLRSTRAALRLVRRSGAEWVYVSTLTQPWWLVVARLAGVPVVCHVHEAEGSSSRPVRTALALPLLLARRVVFNSCYARDVALGAVPGLAGRAVVVPNGVEGPPRSLTPVAGLRGPGGPLSVLYVGRLSQRKGVAVLLDAVADLVERGVDADLTLLGGVFPGNEAFEAGLRAQAQAPPLAGRVRFAGFDPDVWRAAESCHVWVVPSCTDEPFGNTAVEALLAGRPLVATRTSGLLEAAGGYESVVMADPGGAGALADALADVDRRWDDLAAAVPADSAHARRRHDPAAYRRAVVATLQDA